MAEIQLDIKWLRW